MKVILERPEAEDKPALSCSLLKELLWSLEQVLVTVTVDSACHYNPIYHFYRFQIIKETFKGDVKSQEQVLERLKVTLQKFAKKQEWSLSFPVNRQGIQKGYVYVYIDIKV